MLSWRYMSNTALIMCTYIRFENLQTTLECVRKQTNKDFIDTLDGVIKIREEGSKKR